MALILRDPFREIENFHQKINDMLEHSVTSETNGLMPVNVYERDNLLVIDAEVPRFTPEEVDINITKDRIEITAEHSSESENKDKKYFRRESNYSRLYRQVALPENIDVEKAKAIHKNGVVMIEIPLSEITSPKKLEITSED